MPIDKTAASNVAVVITVEKGHEAIIKCGQFNKAYEAADERPESLQGTW